MRGKFQPVCPAVYLVFIVSLLLASRCANRKLFLWIRSLCCG